MTWDRPLKVLVVDDHDLFRTGLRALLEDEGLPVSDCASGDEALRLMPSFRPDVVVMDVNMPGMSGIEATRRVRATHPSTSVLMLTIDRDDERVLQAVRAGASGYLIKDAEFDEIVGGIRAAAAGKSVLADAAAGALIAEVRAGGERPAVSSEDAVSLSDREREVLDLLARGCNNAEIAERLYLSLSTVKHHVSRVLDKLGVDNRLQAAAYAIRHRLVDDYSVSG